MVVRTSRRRFVSAAAGVTALLATSAVPLPVPAPPAPTVAPTVNALLASFVAALAGEDVPADVAAIIDTPAIEPRALSVFTPLDNADHHRHLRYQAAHAAIVEAARRYRDGDTDEAALKDAAHDALTAAWQLGEEQVLAAKIVAHERRVATRPADDAEVSARLAYLTQLVAQREDRASRGDTAAADTLTMLNRCLDLPIDCLDGAFARGLRA